MIEDGFLFGLAKCKFLVSYAVVLGFRVFMGEYQLGKKVLLSLLG